MDQSRSHVDFSRPYIEGKPRAHEAKHRRKAAAQPEHPKHDAVLTEVNDDEALHYEQGLPSNFTKGLRHSDLGLLANTNEYDAFVTEVNQPGNPVTPSDFSSANPGIMPADYKSSVIGINDPGPGTKPNWRGWESPRAGHYYDLQGPDADAFGMAPAPDFGSSELSAEMAEVYAMAMLRDVPFRQISLGAGVDANTGIGTADVIDALNGVPYFDGSASGLSLFARRRRAGRLNEPDYDMNTPPDPAGPSVTPANLFRGSGPGAKVGPYVSQFMLIGNGANDTVSGAPGSAAYGQTDGYINYGNQPIDQRGRVFLPGLDYMTSWAQWHDVQQGADVRGAHVFDPMRRFISTPRHLATYVRFDALYQAYLNACLLLLGQNYPTQGGFPDQGDLTRTPFASFGGPHVLSLMTEVATRCLKFARRQKFNYHRRARPEKISGILAVADGILAGRVPDGDVALDVQTPAIDMLNELGALKDLVATHNRERESGFGSNASHRRVVSNAADEPSWITDDNGASNLLLAMAFPEGSPMHPSYAAGHATVAGGCVTMLKAFFETMNDDWTPKTWSDSAPMANDGTGLTPVEASDDGTFLTPLADDQNMTVEGELNKLAANISVARNMAGVHYYSDYYDSLRMGERVAVGILADQMHTYDERVIKRLRSFDGDRITLDSQNPGDADIETATGDVISYRDWCYRHMEDTTPTS